MREKVSGLAGKLVIAVIVLGILLGVVTSVVGYREFTAVLERQYNDNAYEIAETACTYLNPDKFGEYLSTGKKDAQYEEIEKRLDALVDATGATFIYVAKVDTADYRTLTYIYDSVNSSTGYDRYELGYTAIGVDEKYVNNVRNIITKGERATEYLYSYSEESGAHTTAGIPVYDSEGTITAILGVEKAMTRLQAARDQYVMHVVLLTLVAVGAFLILYTAFLNREMISPILAITEESKRFADSNIPSDALLSIRKKDEIGVLAKAIHKMESDIEQYIRNLTAVTAEKERIGAELNVATQIQASMLPCIFPPFPERGEFDIYASMNPAKEVGGDFYDFFLIDRDHLGLVIADVSGKGVPAALFMVISKTLLKNQAMISRSPGKILEIVNDQLCESNEAEMFVTVWLAVYEISTGKLTAANAGHEYPAIRRAGGTFELYKDRHGFVLAGMEHTRYREYELSLHEGDTLFVYTDGVAEATNADNELFGTERLLQALNREPDGAPKDLLFTMKRDIDLFVGDAPQFDDITMLALKMKGT